MFLIIASSEIVSRVQLTVDRWCYEQLFLFHACAIRGPVHLYLITTVASLIRVQVHCSAVGRICDDVSGAGLACAKHMMHQMYVMPAPIWFP